MTLGSPRLRSLRPDGFTLVEVTLALGICGFGLVTLLGLIPIGLTTARSAINTGAQAQIMRQLSGVLGQAHYGDLSTMNGKTYYFDDQGIGLTADKAAQSVFRATLDVPASAGSALPMPTNLPAVAAAGGGVPSPRLATVGVNIVVNGNAQNQVHQCVYVVDRGW